ncbi:MAG: class I SAM-dependent methyltransferase [Thermoplasmatales archaeon]
MEIAGPFRRTVEINFVKDGDSFIIIPTGSWAREISIYPYVRLDGAVLKASFDTLEKYGEMFRKKYGPEHFNRYFSKTNISIVLTPWKDQPGYTYEDLGKIFDIANENYISNVSANWVQLYMRDESLKLLRRYVKNGDRILDLGCGPMSEALSLGSDISVTEVDVSETALRESKKFRTKNVDHILFNGPESISDVYDVIFSSYGFLNVEKKENVMAIIERNLKSGGVFVGSFLNKFGAMDIFLNAVLGRLTYCRQRVAGILPVNFSRYNILSYPREPNYLLDTGLVLKEERRGVCLITPPYNFTGLVNAFGDGLIVRRLDSFLCGLPLAWFFSDYVLFAYRKSA